MRVKDPVETFDDYVLLEIFAHVPPEDVVRASYNTSRRWRALITRLKLCKPIFFGLSNVNTADPYVLRQRAQCDHRFGESTKVNWRAHCVANMFQERAWASGKAVVRWSPDIIETGIWGGRTNGARLQCLDHEDNTLLYMSETTNPAPTPVRGTRYPPTRQLWLIDAKTLMPKFDPVILPHGEYEHAFVVDVLGHVLCRHLRDDENELDRVEVWVRAWTASLFGKPCEPSAEMPEFQHLVSFKLPYHTDPFNPYLLRVDRDEETDDLALILAAPNYADSTIVLACLATTVDGGSCDPSLQSEPLATINRSEMEQVAFDPEFFTMDMDQKLLFIVGAQVQVYSRDTCRHIMSIPVEGGVEAATDFPVAVAYDLTEAVRSVQASADRAAAYANPPVGKPLVFQSSMRGSTHGSTFEAPRLYHSITGPIVAVDYHDDKAVFPVGVFVAVAGDDLVVEYDWFGLQVIKQYQAVLLHAETMEASDREEYVASNSIFIGYTAEVGKGGHDIVASGTRVIITQTDHMFVMDMASMSLPEPDTTPTPIPLTVIYGVNRDGYWPGESPRATAMSNGAFYELVPLHGSNERVYRAAAQRDIMMAPWKDWWSDTNCPDFVTVPDPRQPYYGLRVVEFGAEPRRATPRDRWNWLEKRSRRPVELPLYRHLNGPGEAAIEWARWATDAMRDGQLSPSGPHNTVG